LIDQLSSLILKKDQIIQELEQRIFLFEYEKQERLLLGLGHSDSSRNALLEDSPLAQLISSLKQKLADVEEYSRKKIEFYREAYRKEATKNANFKARIRELETKLAAPDRNSTNGNCSPASDLYKIVDPFEEGELNGQENPEEPKRKQGAQVGHPGHRRNPFKPEESEIVIIEAVGPHQECPHCKDRLVRDPDKDITKDHYEIPARGSRQIIEVSQALFCPHCNKHYYTEKPKGGFNGSLLSTIIVAQLLDLNIKGHMTQRALQRYLWDHKGIRISGGCLNNILKAAGVILRSYFLEILDAIRSEAILHLDETSHRYKDIRLYTWVARGKNAVLFYIGPRSKESLEKILGPDMIERILTTDYYSVYRSFSNDKLWIKHQYCLEHLKRAFKYCAQYDLSCQDIREYGEKGVKLIRELIHTHNQHKELLESSEDDLVIRAELSRLKEDLIAHALNAPESCPKAKAIAARFKRDKESYFTFIDTPGIEPTNNLAEISLRDTAVIHRKISSGSQSISGIYYYETLWTIESTLRLQGRNPLPFLEEVLEKACNGEPLYSILNPGQPIDPKYIAQAKEEAKEVKVREALLNSLKGKRKKVNSKDQPKEAELPRAKPDIPSPSIKGQTEEPCPEVLKKAKQQEAKPKNKLKEPQHLEAKPKEAELPRAKPDIPSPSIKRQTEEPCPEVLKKAKPKNKPKKTGLKDPSPKTLLKKDERVETTSKSKRTSAKKTKSGNPKAKNVPKKAKCVKCKAKAPKQTSKKTKTKTDSVREKRNQQTFSGMPTYKASPSRNLKAQKAAPKSPQTSRRTPQKAPPKNLPQAPVSSTNGSGARPNGSYSSKRSKPGPKGSSPPTPAKAALKGNPGAKKTNPARRSISSPRSVLGCPQTSRKCFSRR
jgi:uncharacterized protein YbaR (Trm112 family)